MQSAYDWKNIDITGSFLVSSFIDPTTDVTVHIKLVGGEGTHARRAP
jgi:hypothetical protein